MTHSLTRTERLRLALGESQALFARRLGCSQPTIDRLESGQSETGAQRILLDQIERDLAAISPPSPASEPAVVPSAPPRGGATADGACSTVSAAVEQGGGL
jgi:hypothetical protein